MPGSLITESYRKRRAPESNEAELAAAKRRKAADAATPADSLPAAITTKHFETVCSTADCRSQHTLAEQPKDQDLAEHSPRKENCSPNHDDALSYMEQQFGLSDELCCSEQSSDDDQIASIDRQPQQPHSTDGFLNLLLLADSSLDDTEQPPEQQDSGNYCDTTDNSAQSADSSSTYDTDSQHQVPRQQTAQSVDEHQTVAGLRPSAVASAASLAAIDFDSDSSSEEEPEPTPSKPRKVQGCGRYGQELNNIAGLALKQTTLLKKKCANRTAKTIRQLKSAPDHSCEAAQRAVEASRLAEEKVQNLARFADAFDDLVKQAVHAANAAAQERADFFASVAAAEMAAAMRGRVASKRSKRRTSSPKQSKNLTWAAAEQLVQQRVFSKADSLSASRTQDNSKQCERTHE